MIKKCDLILMGFSQEEADLIEDLDLKYSNRISSLVKAYVSELKDKDCFLSYTGEERNDSYSKAVEFINSVNKEIPEIDEYSSRLLGWLNCVPYLHESYKKHGLDDNLFYDTMKDFSYKFKECQAVHGAFGLFVDWFFLLFELRMFTLGRLQYEVSSFMFDEYSYLKKGDTVYSCHIPSSGKLTEDLCLESFQRAYEFFKPNLSGNLIPIISHTWLLYKPYAEFVFPKDSNLFRFANLFDVVDCTCTSNRFDDAWRVFNKDYDGDVSTLPSDNRLRCNFINYIKNGGDFGYGYGIIIYNGETGEIVNRK